MKIMMLTIASFAVILLSGCATPAKHVNLTGKWDYDYKATGQSKVKTGAMIIQQNEYKITGAANDAEGQFVLKGVIADAEINLKGVDQAKKHEFEMRSTLSSDSEFSGEYRNNQGVSGTIVGKRR